MQLPGAIDYPALRQAVAGALAAAPRARGRMAAGRALRRRYTWEFPPVPDIDPLSQSTWSDEQELAVIRVGFMASSPPLRTSPPIRLLLASGPDASCVMLNAHHAAMDGMSCVEFLRDIAARYRAIAGDPPQAPTSADWSPESRGALDAPESRWPLDPGTPSDRAPRRSRRRRRGHRNEDSPAWSAATSSPASRPSSGASGASSRVRGPARRLRAPAAARSGRAQAARRDGE